MVAVNALGAVVLFRYVNVPISVSIR